MGQSYEFIILGEKPNDTESETIRAFVDPGTIPIGPSCRYGHGSKLTEHSGFGSAYIRAIEALLAPGRMFYRSRIVWAGDYADCEPNSAETAETATAETATAETAMATTAATAETAKNLHQLVQDELEAAYEKKKKGLPIYSRMLVPIPNDEHFRYLVNHTKRLYVDTTRVGSKPKICYNNCRMHPLPLLVAEGNNRGGGDYGTHGNDFELCGTWARDAISVDDVMPTGFDELVCNFWD